MAALAARPWLREALWGLLIVPLVAAPLLAGAPRALLVAGSALAFWRAFAIGRRSLRARQRDAVLPLSLHSGWMLLAWGIMLVGPLAVARAQHAVKELAHRIHEASKGGLHSRHRNAALGRIHEGTKGVSLRLPGGHLILNAASQNIPIALVEIWETRLLQLATDCRIDIRYLHVVAEALAHKLRELRIILAVVILKNMECFMRCRFAQEGELVLGK